MTFHVLPIKEIGAGDELYIKMNSRGKPLTPFENFKARFEKALEGSPRAGEFAERIDGKWADVLWRYRGSDDVIDDELVRYFTFVTEIAEWRTGMVRPAGPTDAGLEPRAEQLFGTANPNGPHHLDFLFQAFDAWVDEHVPEFFAGLITTDAAVDGRVRFFGSTPVDLFHACCERYDFGRQSGFGWAETLTLYAVLLHRIHKTEAGQFSRRLRVLRNLLEASTNELRLENMPNLVGAVKSLVLTGTFEAAVAELSAFNEAQIEDERLKAEFLAAHPDLVEVVFRLEDHHLLRGSLVAFDLDADRLAARSRCFEQVMADRQLWPTLTAALLSVGDYSRNPDYRFRFGSPTDDRWWRELLTGTKPPNLATTATVLAKLLDSVASSGAPLADALGGIREDWLAAQQTFDWRYYLVKYPEMRAGKSGIYVPDNQRMGFQLAMLDKTQMNSHYRDPYLHAMRAQVPATSLPEQIFTGYEERWLRLPVSETKIRCIDEGFRVEPPTDPAHTESFQAVCKAFGIGLDCILTVEQTESNGHPVDTEDRIELGARLLAELIRAGL